MSDEWKCPNCGRKDAAVDAALGVVAARLLATDGGNELANALRITAQYREAAEKTGCTLRDVCDGSRDATAPRCEQGDEVKLWSAEADESALTTARIDGARAFAEWLDANMDIDVLSFVEAVDRWLASESKDG
jgi:hypothetical protein